MTNLRQGSTATRLIAVLSGLVLMVGCSESGRNPSSPSNTGTTSAAKPPSVSSVQSTTISFSGFNAAALSVGVDTLTTSSVGQPYISQGKIQLSILVDGSGNPVPCGTAGATYVRFDGSSGGGMNPNAGGQTLYALDFDNLDASTSGAVHNVQCGASVCIRAHYVTGGGPTKVETHMSPETPYQLPCPSCTVGLGYWKNHYPANWPASVLAGGLTLGTVSYTAAQLDSILNTPPAGNGLIILAHQLITAKLNIANGVAAGSVASAIASADALIGGLIVPPVGGGSLAPGATGALTQTLDNFNSGLTGPGACPSSSGS